MSVVDTAVELQQAGLSVVPVAADGSKRPALHSWKRYTGEAASAVQVRGWFDEHAPFGVGIITGYAGVELLEVEGRAMPGMRDVLELLDGTGLRHLYDSVVAGWSEQSPSGGLHLLYRLADGAVPGNAKIAQEPDGASGRVTLAETRGTGGFVVLAPSGGTVHPTGRPYVRLSGGPSSMLTISRADRDALHTAFHAAMDRMPPEPAPAGPVDAKWSTAYRTQAGDVTPGDDFESKTDWADILDGWTLVHTRGRTRYWRRPGKDDGLSATTGHADDRDRLYVFSSSTRFEPGVPYTKFGAYTVLRHGGDHAAAAKALAGAGFGVRAPRALAVQASASRTTSTGTVMSAVVTATAPVVIGSEAADLTDDGNARLLVAAHSATLRYVPDAGKWVTWDGTRWVWQPDDGPAVEAAKATIRAIPTDNKQLAAWRVKSLAARHIGDAVRLARSTPEMRVGADQFDRHAWQLNTPGGIINLHDGSVAAATPALFHSRQTAVTPDTSMPTPRWDKFLDETFQSSRALIRYVQQLAGLSAVGEVLEHVLPFLHGGGNNGKTVLLEVLTGVLGDYATEAPQGFLVAGRDRHETELANLQGRRLVVGSEVNERTRFDEAKMKALTGGDKITARFMRRDFFTFIPSHTLWLAANNQPSVETGGRSFWRRLRLIPFEHQVDDKDVVKTLGSDLIAEEGPGILAWVIAGAVDYATAGLQTPPEVLAATSEYQAEEDHLGRFVEDRCIIGGGDTARVATADLRRAYDTWCDQQHETPMSAQSLGRQLRQRFAIESVRSHGARYYTGVLLAGQEDDDDGSLPGTGEWWDR